MQYYLCGQGLSLLGGQVGVGGDDASGCQHIVHLLLASAPCLDAVQSQQLLHGAEQAFGPAGDLNTRVWHQPSVQSVAYVTSMCIQAA